MTPITQAEWDEMLAAVERHVADGGPETSGKMNGYFCRPCGHTTVICRLADSGVTPFIVTCPKCRGEATSMMYRVPQTSTWARGVRFEFFRPTLEEANRLIAEEPGYRSHLLGGGLVLRPVERPQLVPAKFS